MATVRVKVCGITRLEDAVALDAMGVDWLGFNFHPGSKRFIKPEDASAIISKLRKAEPVGVFVDAAPERIAETAARTGIRAVQLHGKESWDVVERVALPIIKAIPHSRLADFGGLKPGWELHGTRPKYFLVDTQSGSEFGGTGQSFDWNLLQGQDLPLPYFLAGGLGPDNLAEAVRRGKPFAVDLNSRVESAPGIKNVDLVKKCLEILGII